MAVVEIEVSSCDRSPSCPARRACPKGAIVPVEGGAYPGSNGYTVIKDKCSECGVCVRVCAGGAVVIR